MSTDSEGKPTNNEYRAASCIRLLKHYSEYKDNLNASATNVHVKREHEQQTTDKEASEKRNVSATPPVTQATAATKHTSTDGEQVSSIILFLTRLCLSEIKSAFVLSIKSQR